MADANQTIIIKKIKKGGHGHHGGAWKVAYADFVTAMMAFFLLMWLLNATEAENLAGLADYFAPTVGVQGQMGIGFRGGKGALSSGIGADKNTNRGIVFGGVPDGPIMKVTEKIELVTEEDVGEKLSVLVGDPPKVSEGDDSPDEAERIEALSGYLNEAINDGGSQVAVTVTQAVEGLEIQFLISDEDSMFNGNTAELTAEIDKALVSLSEVISKLPNPISITGHTSSVPVRKGKNYGNWELSADRANSVRRLLLRSGVQAEQISEVIGKSDNEPFDRVHPDSDVNNRISLVLLKPGQGSIPDHKVGAPKGVFVDSTSEDAIELMEEGEDENLFEEDEQAIDEDLEKIIEDTFEEFQDEDAFEFDPENPFGTTDNAFSLEELDAEEEKVEEEETEGYLIDEDDDDDDEEIDSADPFAGASSSAPSELFVEEEGATNTVKEEAPVNSSLFEEDDDIVIDNISNNADPFAGETSSAPSNLFADEEGARKEEEFSPVNADLFKEDDINIENLDNNADPFAGKNASAPENLFVDEEGASNEVELKPKNAYLLEDDDEGGELTEEEYQNLKSRDPFSDGLIPNPFGQ